MNPVDILIVNGTVLTMDAEDRLIENGVIGISGDAICAVGPAGSVSEKDAGRVIDAAGGIVMPGLINTHTHAAMTCFRGLADDLELMTWLHDYIFPAETRLTADRVHTGALLACAEMMLSGTTCFSDMYLFEDAVAEAAKKAGVRAVVGEVLYDFPSPNYGPIEQGFAYTEQLIEKWRDDPLITIAVEPHSPYLCAPEILERSAALSADYDIPLIIHLSETEDEVATIRQRYGKTPVAHLADLGVLSPRLLACHCVVLSDADIRLLANHHVKVSHNPESNMKLAAGIAPVPDLISAGICVGLGTDGSTSNNNVDMFMEMDTAAKLHKVNTLDPTVMDAGTVLRMATIEAARALGLDHEIGSLEAGKKADILIIDTNKPHLTPMYNVHSHLVYSACGSDVATVIVNGRPVVEAGRVQTFDVGRVMDEMRGIAADIRNSLHPSVENGQSAGGKAESN